MRHRRLESLDYFTSSNIRWPSFRGSAALVGTSATGVSVYVDSALGSQGQASASDLLSDADRVVNFNNATFGVSGEPVNVIVFAIGGATDGTGGADHMGCTYDPSNGGDIEVCIAYNDPLFMSMLFEAELSECAMNGQLCGLSTGEALSRWCGAAIYGALPPLGFQCAPTWDQDGRPDFVNQTDLTDGNYDSIGCGTAFISWLLSRGHKFPDIAQKMVSLGDSGTLAQLYLDLGETGDPWQTFLAALPQKIDSDDPFSAISSVLAPAPAPLPSPPPASSPTPTPTPGHRHRHHRG